MASNLMESKQCSGRYWDCPMCAMKIYPPRMGEIRQPVSLVGTCSHDICMSCIIATACPVQLKKAIDKGKSVEVHCPIVCGEKGDVCGGRGCTPEFSRAKAKKRRFGSTYATKNGRAGRATSHFYPSDKSPIFYKTASAEIDPCDIIIAPLLGRARGFGDAVAGGLHLCVRLRSQNREFAAPRGEKNIADGTKTPRRWQFFRCRQHKCPHATSEVLPAPNKDARLSPKTPQHALYL
jgi:hypothetical protein